MTHGVCVQTDIQFNGVMASKGILHFSEEGVVNLTTKRYGTFYYYSTTPKVHDSSKKQNTLPCADLKKYF